jgi:hypothetical protein
LIRFEAHFNFHIHRMIPVLEFDGDFGVASTSCLVRRKLVE